MSSGEELLAGTRVVVTGASGTVGRALVAALVRAGAEVVGVDLREPEPPTSGTRDKDPDPDRARIARQVRSVAADLTRGPDGLAAACEGARACVHLAGHKLAHVGADDVFGCFEANVRGTAAVAEACRRAGATRVVFASTGHVYGPSEREATHETDPVAPRSAYAASKASAEEVLRGFALAGGPAAIVARLSNIYGGATLDDRTVVGRALALAREKAPIALRTHDAVRDFIHVKDVAAALVALLTLEAPSPFEVFNVGGGVGISTGEVASRVARAAKRAGLGALDVPAPEDRESPGAHRLVLATSRLTRRTGFSPEIDFDASLLDLLR